MQLRFDPSDCKYFEDFGIGIFDRVSRVVWYQFGKNGIAFKIWENKKVIIAANG